MEAGLQRDINALVGKLRKIDGVLTKDIKRDLRTAAAPIATAIKNATPVGKREHKRYLVGGRLAATYRPGNLKKSFRVLNFRRARRAVYVGPLSKGGIPDGYYAGFLEFGTAKISERRFIEGAVLSTYPTAQKFLIEILRRRIAGYVNEVGV